MIEQHATDRGSFAISRVDVPLTAGTSVLEQVLAAVQAEAPIGRAPQRFAISEWVGGVPAVEVVYSPPELASTLCLPTAGRGGESPNRVVVHVVPTSIGASVGGFAGDASPATRLLAAVADKVLTHPNVLNASDIIAKADNTLYVEGSMLDRFYMGEIALRPSRHRLGVVMEKQPTTYLDKVRYSIDAAHATGGIPFVGYAVTEEKIGVRVRRLPSGAYAGVVDNISTLLRAAERLVKAGATAIALTTEILDLPDLLAYVQGLEPNPHGGVEALLSRSVSNLLNVPCAHAPMWGEQSSQEDPEYHLYDPREAAELVTTTALHSVLVGLSTAPRPIPVRQSLNGDLRLTDVFATVLPASAVGGIPGLVSEFLGIPIIGVKDNETVQDLSGAVAYLDHLYPVQNYYEAAGFVAALQLGISTASLERPLSNVAEVR